VAISDHPKYGKYFRMLKVGLPREAIKAKMQHEGMNPSYLDKDPSEVIPIDSGDDNGAAGGAGGGGSSNEAKVAVADHPAYAKYFKMMKVGLPKEAIKAKMQQEGVNPSYLDKDPTELVPLVESKTPGGGDAAAVTRPKGPNPALALIAGNAAALSSGGGGKNIPKLRKKKLYWKALDASQVGRDSLWADKDDDITLDEAEFNQLFVERYVLTRCLVDNVVKRAGTTDTHRCLPCCPLFTILTYHPLYLLHSTALHPLHDSNDDLKKPQGEVRAAAGPLVSRKRVNLIDMKRGQNAGIALARIKMSFAEVKERISLMDDEIFTTDQLRSLSVRDPTHIFCPVLSCPVLSCPVMSCPVHSYSFHYLILHLFT
jgi:Subunit CCDC53 of WASH complex